MALRNLGLPAAAELTSQQSPRTRLSLAHTVELWERSILPIFHMRAAGMSLGSHLFPLVISPAKVDLKDQYMIVPVTLNL